MEHQLLKQLLDIEFYTNHKDKLNKSLFEDEILDLYEVIVDAHDKYGADLTTAELEALWLDANPVATTANKAVMSDIIHKIEIEPKMNPALAGDLLEGLWTRDLGRRIANLGLDINQGSKTAFDKLLKLIDRSKEGLLPDDFGEDTTKDLNELLELTSNEHRSKFNIPTLFKHCYGIGPAEFMVYIAPPETGKTAFAITLAFGPGGFCDQGDEVLYLGNEEKTARSMLRAYSCYTGMKAEHIAEFPDIAKSKFSEIEPRVHMKDINGWDTARVEAYINKKKSLIPLDDEGKPTRKVVVIIDQADKVMIQGSYNATHEKLRALYTELREIAKRCDCAIIVASQASNDAVGKTVVSMNNAEGSKIGKSAECDIMIGIGKFANNEDGTYDPTRFLTVDKNKLTGWHGTLACKLEASISRYED